MEHLQESLNWIETQGARMEALVEAWANINSGSDNTRGLEAMCGTLRDAFESLQGRTQVIALAPRKVVGEDGDLHEQGVGPALSIVKRPEAQRKVILSAHMDTVFGEHSPFQRCERLDRHTLRGPGVADIKGGLVIMLIALECLERSSLAENLGWEVFLNPDEEVGSPSSAPLLQERAKNYNLGLVFEPPYPDGSHVSARKGSAVYTVVSRGRAAHSGRAFDEGINALVALLPLLKELSELNDNDDGTTLNIGTLRAGDAVNIVPDLAIVRFGVRAVTKQALAKTERDITAIVERARKNSDALSIELHRASYRAPKPFTPQTEALFSEVSACAELLGLPPMSWKTSGGVCDGNTLASEGLPCFDTLGAIGGGIHTTDEYIDTTRLVERAKLVAVLLLQLASGNIKIPEKE